MTDNIDYFYNFYILINNESPNRKDIATSPIECEQKWPSIFESKQF